MSNWWLVPGDARSFRYPEQCACCDAQTKDLWDVVPYCATCRAHVPGVGPWLAAAAAIGAGLGAAYAMHATAPFAPFIVHLGAVVAATFALPILWVVVARRRRVGQPHADTSQAAEITSSGLLVRSKAWADRVAADNNVTAAAVEESKFALLERALPFLATVAPIAALMFWFPHWHVRLWIDNGTAQAATIRADGREIAKVAAGATASVELPRAQLAITSDAGDDALLDPQREETTWILNVGRAHCYELRGYGYTEQGGTGFYLGPNPQPHTEVLFPITADWLFQGPPQTITVDKSHELPGLQTLRFALEIVPCRR